MESLFSNVDPVHWLFTAYLGCLPDGEQHNRPPETQGVRSADWGTVRTREGRALLHFSHIVWGNTAGRPNPRDNQRLEKRQIHRFITSPKRINHPNRSPRNTKSVPAAL